MLKIMSKSPIFNCSLPLNKMRSAPKNTPPAPMILYKVVFSPMKGVNISVKMISERSKTDVFVPEVLLAPMNNKV